MIIAYLQLFVQIEWTLPRHKDMDFMVFYTKKRAAYLPQLQCMW